MSSAIVAASCCCGTQTPATNCPPDGPGPDPTVRISITATPTACSNFSAINCVQLDCGWGGYIVPAGPCNFSCTPQIPWYGPEVIWTSNLARATATYAWGTYTDEPFNPCPGGIPTYNSVVACGYKSLDFETWNAEFKFTLACGPGDSLDTCFPCTSDVTTQYWPSQESYDNGNGVRVIASGCCCVNCACVGNPKCSSIYLFVRAVWLIEVEIPLTEYSVNPAFPGGGLWCNMPDYDRGAWVHRTANATQTVVFTHVQELQVVLEQTIYTNQAEASLAPGSYSIRCIREMVNQCQLVGVLGGGYVAPGTTCGVVYAPIQFFSAGIECDLPCLVQGQTCTNNIGAHGWGLSVSVAAA